MALAGSNQRHRSDTECHRGAQEGQDLDGRAQIEREAVHLTTSTTSRRGRPRAGERAERERRIVAAALEELIEHGYERVTMLGIASRAGA